MNNTDENNIRDFNDEEFMKALEEEAQKFLAKRPKKEKVFTDEFLDNFDSRNPWDKIPEQDYNDFMEFVSEEWESEMHSEGYAKSYEKVRWDCWEIYSGRCNQKK
ncbi:hypothetical protein [Pseudoalteromonas phage PH357]|nr:hypothetical protein [Pseudoalteromonas phage PH357]